MDCQRTALDLDVRLWTHKVDKVAQDLALGVTGVASQQTVLFADSFLHAPDQERLDDSFRHVDALVAELAPRFAALHQPVDPVD